MEIDDHVLLDVVIEDLLNWRNSIEHNIRILTRYYKTSRVINIVLLTLLAGVTATLGALESMSLAVEVTEGQTNWSYIISIIKLILIVIGAVLTSLLANINPVKLSKDSMKGIRDYSILVRAINSKIVKYKMNYDSSNKNIVASFERFKTKYSEIENNIIESTPITNRPEPDRAAYINEV